MQHARLSQRALALLVDLMVLDLGSWALARSVREAVAASGAGPVPYLQLQLAAAAALLYWPLLECSSRQGTIGKYMLHLRVTDLEGRRISIGRAALRGVGRLLSALPLLAGFALARFNARRQTLHDLIAGTLVLAGRPDDPVLDTER